MPRSIPRPTLKLPAKTATPSDADNTRSLPRKPVRGGFKAPKQTVAQRDVSRAKPAVQQPPSPVAVPAPAEKTINATELPSPREVRTQDVPKVYPKRGIARSTGARALPPARPYGDRTAFTPEPAKFVATPEPHAAATKLVRRPLNEPPRLSKRISEMCQCSRREADEWIENGWVRVDGVVVTTLGTRAHPNAKIEIKDEASKHATESVTVLFNKSLDTASDREEAVGEAALQLIRPDNRWAEDDTRYTFKATHLRGLALAGKLDPESTGMLVFTQEGSVARGITGDDTRLEKEYRVRVEGELTPDGLKLLNHGLALDDIKLKRAQVSWQNEEQLRFVLHESRKRQIQRMCELVGLRVVSIKRIRVGSVSLGKLPAGQWRYLRENERF